MTLVPALNILTTALADSSYALLAGALLAGFWLDAANSPKPAAVCDPALRRLRSGCLAVLITCHLAHPWFVASSMSGSTRFGETLALVPTILSSTRQGGLWYANSLALAALLAAPLLRLFRAAAVGPWVALAALAVVAATKAGSSHASEAGDFTLPEIAQFLHLLATSVWAGAILVSGFLVVPRVAVTGGAAALWSYGSLLSKTVTYALALLLLTGLYISWNDMRGAVSTLWTNPWGRILLAKGALVASAVLLGSLTRFRCLGRSASPQRAALMCRLLRAEAAVMLAILCLSGLLANTSPGA